MRTTRRIAALALTAAAALSVGCSSTDTRHAGDIEAIRSNPSPAMDTLAQRGTDISNRRTVTFDTNLRMLTDDIDRALMIDRPSRLTFYPATRR